MTAAQAPHPKHRPFGAAGAVAIVFVALSIGQLASLVAFFFGVLVIALANAAGPVDALNAFIASPAFLPLSTIPTSCALVLVSVTIARIYGIPFARAVAWARPHLLPTVVSLVLVFCVAVVASALVGAFREAFPGFTLGVLEVLNRTLAEEALVYRIPAVIALAVFPPVAEELLFRGIILGSVRARRGVLFAVICSSVLFGLMHVEPLQVLNGMLIGLALGVVAWRTASVVPAIIAHAINNGLACYAAFTASAGPDLEPPTLFVVLAAILVVPAGVLLFRLTRGENSPAAPAPSAVPPSSSS